MRGPIESALVAMQRLRAGSGYAGLSASERQSLDADLGRIEAALRGPKYGDPYAVPLETPLDLVGAGRGPTQSPPATTPSSEPKPETSKVPAGTEVVGTRADRALDAVDFPSFMAGLIDGTFQAIVDSTTQQVREYASLVASLAQTVDRFTDDNVTANQARDWLYERYPEDLTLVLPEPGHGETPRILPLEDDGDSPEWLGEFDLEGEPLSAELTEGPLLFAARRRLGEERMQHLATMVLMGVNRIVIDDGRISAKMRFHASARERVKAEVVGGGQSANIAQRSGSQAAIQTMVSTVDVNAQSDISIKAELVGEVSLRFRTETFDINRFADTNAIQLITGHSRTTQAEAVAPATAPASEETANGEPS